MKWFLERAVPCAKIFEIAISFDKYEKWLKKEHNRVVDHDIYLGYKYFLECTFSSILDSIGNDNSLNIKSNAILDRALSEGCFIEKLPETCEKTTLLKNIYFYYKAIEESKSYLEIRKNCQLFQENVLSVINNVFDNCFSLNKVLHVKKDLAIELILIESLYLLFHQIKNNGPIAYEGILLKEFWPSEKKRNTFLEGYAITLQFVWVVILGEKKYHKLHIKNLHKSDSWRNYKYIKQSIDNNQEKFSYLFDNTYHLEEQTCFDSYFDWLRLELIEPLEKKYNFFLKQSDNLFLVKKDSNIRLYFKALLTKKRTVKRKLSIEEEIDMMLLWYPVEIANMDTSSMHSGIASLNTLIAGTASLLKKQGEFDKVHVCKFIHPINKVKKHDYSYSVLIDTKAAAGHFSSGWMLYFDCCSDNSGFSRSEYSKVEELIKELQKENLLKLITKNISKNVFKHYIKKYLPSKENLQKKDNSIDFIKTLEKITLTREFNSFISKAKSLVLELISYYVATKYKGYRNFTLIEWSLNSKSGEIDLFLENKKSAILIECKTNINNGDLLRYISQAKSKLNEKCRDKESIIEFWCWVEPSKQNIVTLNENDCEYKSLSSDEKLKFRNLLRLSRISQVLNFNKKNEELFEN